MFASQAQPGDAALHAYAQTQDEIDENRKLIALSNDAENQLKKDIEAQMPFISDLQAIQGLMEEYANTNFKESFDELVKSELEGGRGYSHIRRLRKDGNCFYRSYLFQLFEHYALKLNEGNYKA